MKKYLILSFALIGMYFMNAQAYEGKGDVKINAGLSGYGYGSGITGSIDFGIVKWFSAGVGTDLYFSNPSKYIDNKFFVYGRANFHLGDAIGLPSEWDIYPGLQLGILGNTFDWNAHIGARYFFNDTWGAFLELGNHGALGVSINL